MMLLSLAIAIAALAAGCGGGSGESSSGGSSGAGGPSGAGTSSSSPTKAEFIKQANAICGHDKSNVANQFGAYLKQHQGQGSKEEVFAGMMKAVLLPVIEQDIAKLRTLETPPDDRGRMEAFLAAQQRAVDAMSKLKRLSEGPAGEKYLESASRLAKAYGIEVCAQS
jgi:hypothetical protein